MRMTKKRYVQFEFPYDDFGVKDNETNEELWNPKVVDRLNEQDDKLKELLNSINNRIKFWEEVAKQDPSNIYSSRFLNDLKDLMGLYYE